MGRKILMVLLIMALLISLPVFSYADYLNLVPYSTNSDGSIYNDGLGYKNGYRVRSGGAEASYEHASCTGFIPVSAGDIVYFSGWDFTITQSANAINAFDSSFNNLGQLGPVSNYGIFQSSFDDYNYSSIVTFDNYYSWVVPPESSGVSYIRVSGYSSILGFPGPYMIVSVNQPIEGSPQHLVTVQSGVNGTASASSNFASEGSSVSLNAVPDAGYELDYWQVISGDITVSNNRFVMGTSDVVVRPVFKRITYTVTVQNVGNGTAFADVSTAYSGQTVTLTATPNTDYYFSHWEVLSGGVTISNNKFTMPDSNVSVRAVFAPIEYDISVSSSSGGTASADLSKATYGQTVTLTATPEDGYTFSEWEVTSGNASVINNQFIMPRGDVSVKAIFLPIPVYSVTVESDGNGVASANPTSGYAGTSVTLSAVPSLGYKFDRWEVTSGSVSIVNDEFTLPASDVVIKAHFEPIIYTITLNQGSNGSATVSKTTGIIGDVITLTATPDEYYHFSHWNVIEGGISVDGNSFSMPASNVVIQPVFVEQSAISSGFEYHSGAISGEEEVEFALIDVDFGEQPAGEYLINIYHWGSGCIPTFQIEYNGKYLPFSTTGGVSTVAIEHDGGSLVLDGSLDLVKNLLQSAEGTVVWAGEFGNGNIQFHSISSWTFNIEDIVAIPVDLAHTEDYGIYSALVSFFRDKFDDLISVFGSEEAEEDVGQAQDSLDKEVEELGQLSADLTEQSSNLEQQFNSDFKISDDLSGQTDNIQLIYTGIFSSFGLFSIFIWLPVVLVVIKKLLRL